MRLYLKPHVPSVLKVEIFLDECGRSIETVEVGDTSSADFLAINAFGTVPVLETDAGEFLTESLTICRYLHRTFRSPLFGEEHCLAVEQWERRAELLLLIPAIEYAHQTHPMFSVHFEQNAAWAAVLADRTAKALALFDARLATSPFVASPSFSIADITAYLGVFALAGIGAIELAGFPAVRRWSEEVGARPSMQRLRTIPL